MTTLTINQTMKNGIAAGAKHVLDTISSFVNSSANTPTSVFLDKNAIWEMGISREDVENNLRNPAWRKLGRYL